MLILCLNDVVAAKTALKISCIFRIPLPRFDGFTENFYINDQFLPEICEIMRQKTTFTDDFGKSLLAFIM